MTVGEMRYEAKTLYELLQQPEQGNPTWDDSVKDRITALAFGVGLHRSIGQAIGDIRRGNTVQAHDRLTQLRNRIVEGQPDFIEDPYPLTRQV